MALLCISQYVKVRIKVSKVWKNKFILSFYRKLNCCLETNLELKYLKVFIFLNFPRTTHTHHINVYIDIQTTLSQQYWELNSVLVLQLVQYRSLSGHSLKPPTQLSSRGKLLFTRHYFSSSSASFNQFHFLQGQRHWYKTNNLIQSIKV